MGMINSFVVSVALAITGQVQAEYNPGQVPPFYAPYGAPATSNQMQAAPSNTPYAASGVVGSFTTFQPTAPPPAPGVAPPAPGAVPPPPAAKSPAKPEGAAASTAGQNGCPPAAAAPESVRADWLQPGGCGACWLDGDNCCSRFIKAYYDAFNPSGDEPDSPPIPSTRAAGSVAFAAVSRSRVPGLSSRRRPAQQQQQLSLDEGPAGDLAGRLAARQ